jgi:hypothetical protein
MRLQNICLLAALSLTTTVLADNFVTQLPAAGTSRSSQLWQDPGPNGNDLDGDAVCFEDFTLPAPKAINHLEWWGTGACELGFRVEFWKQDPGTIAYQPIAVFYYGQSPNPPSPDGHFDTTAYTTSPGPNGTTHFTLDLATPVVLPANTPTNPRWFVAVIGLTAQPYATWNWARGTGGSNKTYQFIRGSGPIFRVLGEGRALVLGGVAPPCVGDINGDGAVSAPDLAALLGQWGGPGSADLNGSGTVNASDLALLLSHWGGCP